jgi:triacylglycerol esterase/lipase EstA (alpha/beta hydrolase family)
MRRVMTTTLAALALLFSFATVAQAHTPILFVHGWSESSSLWTTMIGKFEKDGWTKAELNNWSYNTKQSNVTTAKEVATKVTEIMKKTGAAKVDLITHSMGALSTRYYIKNLGGESTIESWVSLGGPNHGTTTAEFCAGFETSCKEMVPKSTFLNELNAGDETPGSVRYATWWSPCDEIINPHESVKLTGATNTETECISHVALTTNEKVYVGVREFVK